MTPRVSTLRAAARSPWAFAAILATALLALPAAPASAAAAPCWVRNVHQDRYGSSLVRMVAQARDGDHLRVRGTCPGEVVIDKDLEIVGRGASPTLTGRERTRVVRVAKGATVTMRGLAIQRGGGSLGGGILNEGRLTLRDAVVRRNLGSGIVNERRLMLIGSVVRHNAGTGIHNIVGSTLEMVDSVIRGNTGAYGGSVGGGLLNEGSTATLRHSTITGNRAHEGGGIFNGEPGSSMNGTLILIGTAVTANVADQGGGIYNWNWSSITLDASSSVTGNVPDDCVGTNAC